MNCAGTSSQRFGESGQLGPFANAYWGSDAYRLPPEANLMAVTHYLEALDFQKEIVKIHTIFGGKNPHPHFLVGGVPSPIDLDSAAATGRKSATAALITITSWSRAAFAIAARNCSAVSTSTRSQPGGVGRLTVAGDPRVGQSGAVGPQRFAVPPPADGAVDRRRHHRDRHPSKTRPRHR